MISDISPKKVLAVAAHADDMEFCFGGSIAKWIEGGATVHYLIVSDGRRGFDGQDHDPNESIRIREDEQKQACNLLGVTETQFLKLEDGRIKPTLELKKAIVQKIRTFKPDTVITIDPTFYYSTAMRYANHADHRAVGEATFDAVYPLSRNLHAFEELKNLNIHHVSDLVMYNLNDENEFVDVEDYFEKKCLAMCAHSSQIESSQAMNDTLEKFANFSGHKAGLEKAEGFVRLRL